MPPDNDAPDLFPYVGFLTRPVHYRPETGLHPLARSALGSLSEGAGSPDGLTEGVCYVEWYAPLVSTAPCRGRQLGDPSGEAALAPLKGELAARTGCLRGLLLS